MRGRASASGRRRQMQPCELARVESENLSDFAQVMETDSLLRSESRQWGRCRSPRLNLEGNQTKNGLGQLVLTLVKVLHELLERQAIRRVEAGSLNGEQ